MITATAEIDRLRAEVERLTAERDDAREIAGKLWQAVYDEARQEALREAAAVAEGVGNREYTEEKPPLGGQSPQQAAYTDAAIDIAEAILALIPATKGDAARLTAERDAAPLPASVLEVLRAAYALHRKPACSLMDLFDEFRALSRALAAFPPEIRAQVEGDQP